MLMVMNAPIVFGLLAVVFGVLPIILRSNAVLMLLTLCSGEVLARLTSQDLTQLASSFITADIPLYSIIQIILLTIAPLLIMIWYRKSAKSDIIIQVLVAVCVAVLSIMLITSKLPYETQANLQNSSLYESIKPYFGVAMAAGLFLSLIRLWLKRPRHAKPEDTKKHHK